VANSSLGELPAEVPLELQLQLQLELILHLAKDSQKKRLKGGESFAAS